MAHLKTSKESSNKALKINDSVVFEKDNIIYKGVLATDEKYDECLVVHLKFWDNVIKEWKNYQYFSMTASKKKIKPFSSLKIKVEIE